jgi:hypothetical protein
MLPMLMASSASRICREEESLEQVSLRFSHIFVGHLLINIDCDRQDVQLLTCMDNATRDFAAIGD